MYISPPTDRNTLIEAWHRVSNAVKSADNRERELRDVRDRLRGVVSGLGESEASALTFLHRVDEVLEVADYAVQREIEEDVRLMPLAIIDSQGELAEIEGVLRKTGADARLASATAFNAARAVEVYRRGQLKWNPLASPTGEAAAALLADSYAEKLVAAKISDQDFAMIVAKAHPSEPSLTRFLQPTQGSGQYPIVDLIIASSVVEEHHRAVSILDGQARVIEEVTGQFRHAHELLVGAKDALRQLRAHDASVAADRRQSRRESMEGRARRRQDLVAGAAVVLVAPGLVTATYGSNLFAQGEVSGGAMGSMMALVTILGLLVVRYASQIRVETSELREQSAWLRLYEHDLLAIAVVIGLAGVAVGSLLVPHTWESIVVAALGVSVVVVAFWRDHQMRAFEQELRTAHRRHVVENHRT